MHQIDEPAEGRITIYSTSWCVWCDRAKRLLDGIGAPYEEIDIESWAAPRDRLEAISGQRSVPQIFIGTTHVGGFDDLVALQTDGVLTELIGSAGVVVAG